MADLPSGSTDGAVLKCSAFVIHWFDQESNTSSANVDVYDVSKPLKDSELRKLCFGFLGHVFFCF